MPKYYLLDENKNLVEGFDKEGFLALLQQAIESGSLEDIDEDSAVASKIRSVLNGTTHHIEFVTQAQYNQLVADDELVPNTYYFITDDTTAEGLEEQLNNLIQTVEDHGERLSTVEPKVTALENKTNIYDLGSANTLESILDKARSSTLFVNKKMSGKFGSILTPAGDDTQYDIIITYLGEGYIDLGQTYGSSKNFEFAYYTDVQAEVTEAELKKGTARYFNGSWNISLYNNLWQHDIFIDEGNTHHRLSLRIITNKYSSIPANFTGFITILYDLFKNKKVMCSGGETDYAIAWWSITSFDVYFAGGSSRVYDTDINSIEVVTTQLQ